MSVDTPVDAHKSRFKDEHLEDIQTPASPRNKKKSPSGSYFWTKMARGDSMSRGQKVGNQRPGWKMTFFLTLCLLQGSSLTPPHRGPQFRWLWEGSLPSRTHIWPMETLTPSSFFCRREKSSFTTANGLKGPRLVSGKPGGAVTIQCHYAPLSVNRHQRKYWCRLGPPKWICQTIVSTNYYTHHHYHGRVALEDFPQRGLFVVRLSKLSLDDVGCYHCGIGSKNDMLFFSMNLTVSAGPSSTLSTTTPAAEEPTMRLFRTVLPAVNRWTPGTTQAIGQGMEWDTTAPTPETSTTTTSTEGRQTPGTRKTVSPGTGSWVEGPIKATAPIPQSPASKIRSMSNTTEGVWVWDTRSAVTNRDGISRDERGVTTVKADGPREETERDRIALDAATKVLGTIRPPVLFSEKLAWEVIQEVTPISKQQFPSFTEGTIPAADMWTLGTISIETEYVEGGTTGDLDPAIGDSGPQARPSQSPAAGPSRPSGKGSSVKSAFPEEENSSQILTPISIMLAVFMLVALVLLQRKLRRRRTCELSSRVTLIQMTHFLDPNLQPDQLPHVERKMLQDDSPSAQPSLTIPEWEPRS
ncbi:high affinity immunoglobulin alpha and immunoglobulin mu Fc receptor [Carlito syrichta]|uniref:high affinity immunoglobulin alpha and immunoglobulin mu Fc receptor n=1 Tax=Carlito syrichta TaxID=1868482 RepID=UPI000B537489|nr:high affinity immunoglobulin alpha and immunoglobulin mu Fc receptor [Carlito syrichta]